MSETTKPATGETAWSRDVALDASGLECPLPVLKARKKLVSMASGQRLLLIATDAMTSIDVPHFCAEAGHKLIATETVDGTRRFLIERA